MKKLLLLLLLACSPAFAAITLIDSGSSSADNTAGPDTTGVGFTTLSLTAGDLIDVNVTSRDTTAITLSVGTTAGLTWTSRTQNNANGVTSRSFCALVTGTGTIAPTFVNSSPSGSAMTAQYSVIRAGTGTVSCTPDVAEATTSFAAPGSPFDVTAVSQTSTAASFTRVYWMVNTSARTWALQTGGWTNIGGTQIRNTTGSGLSSSGAYLIQATAGASGTVTNRQNSTGNAGVYRIVTYKESIAAPVLTASVTSQTTGAYTIGGTTSVSSTVYAVACAKGSTTPTATQIKAGQCTGNVTALAAQTDTWNGADSLVLGTALALPVYDLSVIANNTVDSNLVAIGSSCLNAPATFQYINCPAGLTSISATSPIAGLNATISPLIAIGDIPKLSLLTTPGAYSLTMDAAGDTAYVGTTARQSALLDIYDLNANAFMSGGPTTLYWNNLPPGLSTPSINHIYNVGDAITSTDYSPLANDPEGDTLTCSNPVGTQTAGLAFGGTNNCTQTGTPTTENETGYTYTVRYTDIAGDTSDLVVTDYTFVTVTTPNCVGQLPTACDGLLAATNAGLIVGTATFTYSNLIAPGAIISQIPAAGVEVEPLTSVNVVVSLGTINPSPASNGYTFAIDPDSAGTFYAVSVREHSAVPNCGQVQSHTDGAGLPALGFGQATSIVGEQVTLTISNITLPQTDVYVVGKSPSDVCTPVQPYPALRKSPGTGRQYIQVDVP